MNKEKTFITTVITLTTIAIVVMTMKMCSGSGNDSSVKKEKGWNIMSIFGNDEAERDSAILNAIHQHSRLYTAETTSTKTIKYTSHNQFKVKIAGIEKSVNLPLGKTEAEIPVSVKYKAYIDLEKIGKRDIRIEGDTAIFITLPDPVIEETAVSIDHDREKMEKQWFGKALTYEQYQELVRQAKEQAWDELSEGDQHAITQTAKISATELIMPQLRSLGFKHITIDYRKEFKIFRTKD